MKGRMIRTNPTIINGSNGYKIDIFDKENGNIVKEIFVKQDELNPRNKYYLKFETPVKLAVVVIDRSGFGNDFTVRKGTLDTTMVRVWKTHSDNTNLVVSCDSRIQESFNTSAISQGIIASKDF